MSARSPDALGDCEPLVSRMCEAAREGDGPRPRRPPIPEVRLPTCRPSPMSVRSRQAPDQARPARQDEFANHRQSSELGQAAGRQPRRPDQVFATPVRSEAGNHSRSNGRRAPLPRDESRSKTRPWNRAWFSNSRAGRSARSGQTLHGGIPTLNPRSTRIVPASPAASPRPTPAEGSGQRENRWGQSDTRSNTA